MKAPALRSMLLLLWMFPCLMAAERPGIDTSRIPLPVPRKVDFERDVYPIFKEACISCHGPDKQRGRYRMDTREGAFKVMKDYGPAIVPGRSEESAIIHMVCNLIDEMLMPPPSDKPGESEPLTPEQIGILRAWIDQGAEWPDGPIQDRVRPVTFAADVDPILKAACAQCHSGADAAGGFSVESLARVMSGGEFYGRIIQPGEPDKSALLIIVAGKDPDLPAPDRHRLPPRQQDTLKEWIRQGAKP
jgi:hypothetical protein